MNQLCETIAEGISKMGKVLYTGPLFEGLLKDAGFINIHVHTYKLPLGTWPKDKKMVSCIGTQIFKKHND